VAVPKNKKQLIEAVVSARAALLKEYHSLPESLVQIPGVQGNVKGTKITVCDTLAYLIGWQNLVMKWYEGKAQGEEVIFPEAGFKWNELGRLAQYFYSLRVDREYEELLQEFRESSDTILDLLHSLTNETLYETPWYRKYTLGKMIQYNTSSPMKNIRTKIRQFKKQHSVK